MKNIKLIYFTFIFLIKYISPIIRIKATNEVKSYCEEGLFFINIKVNYSEPFENYYTFNLTVEQPEHLKFKCFLSYQNNSIQCSLNLNSNKYAISRTEILKIPNKFPLIQGFIWDYDSFVKNIYEKELIMEYSCKQKNMKFSLNKLFTDEWGFIININSIYDNKCSYSTNVEENNYVFNMQLNIIDGYLKNKLEKINDDKTFIGFIEIEFLQEIWVPITFGNNENDEFTKNNDYSFAFCSINEKITNLNMLNKDGFFFECYIPIPDEQLMSGIIQIKPFYDQLYLKINEGIPNNNEIFFTNIYFNINRTIEQIDYEDNKNNLNNNNINELQNKEKRRLRKVEEDTNNITDNEIENNINVNLNNETDNENKNDYNDKNDNNDKNDKNNNNDNNDNQNNDNNNNSDNNNINNNNNDNNNDINNSDNTNNDINNNSDINNENNKNNDNDNINNKNNNESKNYITIDYFLIGDNNNKLICPDKPIFTINNKKDIKLKYSHEKIYSFFLRGKLSFIHQKKMEENNNVYIIHNETQKEILFNLQIIDNLAENEDNQKNIVNCIIPNKTYYVNTSIKATCYGNKISEESMQKNDTDITLNWGIAKNRIHDQIIIKWPNIKKKIKNIYSYTIKAFSLSQKNYGCYNNEFYFFIYIYNLEYEPNILFEIRMKEPEEPNAICKIYDSSMLKCYFPLYQQRILRNTKISLPTNITYEINNPNGNKVIFIVDEYKYDYEDFHLVVKETCGDYIFIGALRRAGLSYFMIFMGILGIGAFIFVILVCFVSYVKYKIKHRNRKGQYFAHIEEGDNSGIKGKIIPNEKI